MASTDLLRSDGDLSDEQIEQLLQQAEARLRGEQSTISLVPTSSAALVSTKKPRNASLPAPAVQVKGVARADPKRLVSSEEQKLASQGIRKVEDPIKVKRKQLQASCARPSSHAYEENRFPESLLEWENGLRLGARPRNESTFKFIVTLTVAPPARHRSQHQEIGKLTVSTQNEKASTGPSWYNLPRTDLTPQLKRDLQILRMRNVLDPHRHYKKENNKSTVPDFSQVGTIVEGPTEFFSARVPKRERSKTLAEGVMDEERSSARMKRKYNEIQERKKSGKKGYYRKIMERRYRGKVNR